MSSVIEIFSEQNSSYKKANKTTLSKLLPYDLMAKTGAGLRNALNDYEALLAASLEALKVFELGELDKLDPLIGENACQIRAFLLAYLFNTKLVNTDLLSAEIGRILKKILWLLRSENISKLMSKGVSLKEIFENEDLEIFLDENEFFIIKCFLLTESKISVESDSFLYIKEKCDPRKIKKYGTISSSTADKLLNKIRRALSERSVLFVRYLARKDNDFSLIKMLSHEFTILHNNYLQCSPMFWTYKSILSSIKRERIPIILHVKIIDKNDQLKILNEDFLLFDAFLNERSNFAFVEKISDSHFNKAAFVVQGVSLSEKPLSIEQWKADFLKYGVEDAILAGAADHRQYPNADEENRINALENHEYNRYKSFAKTNGFSAVNPERFFIQHVYASLVSSFFP